MTQLFKDPARARHATKVALSLVIVYWLTLQWGWINPFWAGFAVIFCSLTTQGESLNKMVLRIGGTLIGTAAILTVMTLFGQDRWLFLLACCVFVSVMIYVMSGSRVSYMWQTSAIVALAIAPSYTSDTNFLFQIAMARMLETILGCSIWALVDILLWPVTNADKLRNTAAQLMEVQKKLIQLCGEHTLNAGLGMPKPEEFNELRAQQVQLLAGLNATLQAAGSESYDVRTKRAAWNQICANGDSLLVEIDQWYAGLAELEHLELATVVPDSVGFIDALENRMAAGADAWEGVDTAVADDFPGLQASPTELSGLKHFDEAAVLVALAHLRRIAELIEGLDQASRQINLAGEPVKSVHKSAGSPSGNFLLLDRDRLRGVVYICFVICSSFLLWIYLDPPGHQRIWTVTAIFGVVAVSLPFVRIGSVLLKVFAIFLPIGGLIHVFVMPSLAGYHELGLLIFAVIFAVQYWLRNPLAVMLASVGFLLMTGIENQQTYSFVGIAITYLFILLSLFLLILCSYVLGSARPEKKLLVLLQRYFRSTEFVLEMNSGSLDARQGFWRRWRIAYHQHELATLPAKMRQWSSQINYQLFPANSPEQVATMIGQLDGLRYRLQALHKLREQFPEGGMLSSVEESVGSWGAAMHPVFAGFARGDFEVSSKELTARATQRLERLETTLSELMEADSAPGFENDNRTNAYLLLGVYRGVAAAGLAWVAHAEGMHINQWREECFS